MEVTSGEKVQPEGLQLTRQLSTHAAGRFEHEVPAVWRLHVARQQVYLTESCFGDVKKMLIIWSNAFCWGKWAGRHGLI